METWATSMSAGVADADFRLGGPGSCMVGCYLVSFD